MSPVLKTVHGNILGNSLRILISWIKDRNKERYQPPKVRDVK
jgi:hypothetical protein